MDNKLYTLRYRKESRHLNYSVSRDTLLNFDFWRIRLNPRIFMIHLLHQTYIHGRISAIYYYESHFHAGPFSTNPVLLPRWDRTTTGVLSFKRTIDQPTVIYRGGEVEGELGQKWYTVRTGRNGRWYSFSRDPEGSSTLLRRWYERHVGRFLHSVNVEKRKFNGSEFIRKYRYICTGWFLLTMVFYGLLHLPRNLDLLSVFNLLNTPEPSFFLLLYFKPWRIPDQCTNLCLTTIPVT